MGNLMLIISVAIALWFCICRIFKLETRTINLCKSLDDISKNVNILDSKVENIQNFKLKHIYTHLKNLQEQYDEIPPKLLEYFNLLKDLNTFKEVLTEINTKNTELTVIVKQKINEMEKQLKEYGCNININGIINCNDVGNTN